MLAFDCVYVQSYFYGAEVRVLQGTINANTQWVIEPISTILYKTTAKNWIASPFVNSTLIVSTIKFSAGGNIGTDAEPVFFKLDNTSPTITDTISTGTRQLVSITGNISKLYIALTTAPSGIKTRTFTVYKNGIATALTCTITGAAITGNDIIHTVGITAGDQLSIGMTTDGTPTDSTGALISFLAG